MMIYPSYSLGLLLLILLAASPSLQAPTRQGSYRDAPSQGHAPGFPPSGQHGAVATEVDVCSNVGVVILKQGGNAVDAAIAATLCVGSIDAFHSGLGGGGFGLIRTATDGIKMFDFRETAPGASSQDMYDSNTTSSTVGGLAVGVPGEMRAWQELHTRFGRLPFASLFGPAIELNRNGFKVPNQLGVALNPTGYPFLCKDTLFAESYCPNGIIKKEGDVVKRVRYAATLEKMAREGSNAFYKGKIAENTVAAVNATGGIITLQDLESYQVEWRNPNSITFRNHRVYAGVAPSSGNVVLSTLKTLDQFAELDPTANLTVHRMVEAMKFGYGERTTYADPAFITNVTALQADYIRDTYAKVKAGKIHDGSVGVAGYYDPGNITVLQDAGTSQISVVDAHGIAVTLTTSINTFWGSGVMTADGIILDNTMDDFSKPFAPNVYGYVPAPPNFIRPGKRPLSSISPVIVEDLATGTLQLATGSAGGSRIITAVIQNVFGVLASNGTINLQQSIARPRLHDQLMPNKTSLEWADSDIPGFSGYDNSTARYLASVGHTVSWVAPGSSTAQGVQRFANGTMLAAHEIRQLSSGGAAY
ncbi:hypothetical protein HDU87_007248 [Geranomyces variabilis]|uniref:Glutathione hydrolase n=1 Tax=Geranomyces variabilis TaxID=109894 RepID=A0AAD5XNC2_9FUNG|nr:hypothetical protein HDU87_007248 [Geranomyces variabilis]